MSGLSGDAFAQWVKNYRMGQSAGSKLLIDGYVVDLSKALEVLWRQSGYFTSTGFEFGFGVDASIFGTLGAGLSASSGGDTLDVDGSLQLLGSTFGGRVTFFEQGAPIKPQGTYTTDLGDFAGLVISAGSPLARKFPALAQLIDKAGGVLPLRLQATLTVLETEGGGANGVAAIKRGELSISLSLGKDIKLVDASGGGIYTLKTVIESKSAKIDTFLSGVEEYLRINGNLAIGGLADFPSAKARMRSSLNAYTGNDVDGYGAQLFVKEMGASGKISLPNFPPILTSSPRIGALTNNFDITVLDGGRYAITHRYAYINDMSGTGSVAYDIDGTAAIEQLRSGQYQDSVVVSRTYISDSIGNISSNTVRTAYSHGPLQQEMRPVWLLNGKTAVHSGGLYDWNSFYRDSNTDHSLVAKGFSAAAPEKYTRTNADGSTEVVNADDPNVIVVIGKKQPIKVLDEAGDILWDSSSVKNREDLDSFLEYITNFQSGKAAKISGTTGLPVFSRSASTPSVSIDEASGNVTLIFKKSPLDGAPISEEIVFDSDGRAISHRTFVNFRDPDNPTAVPQTGYLDNVIVATDSAGRPIVLDGAFLRVGSQKHVRGTVVKAYSNGPLEGITRIKLDSEHAPLGFMQFDQAGTIIGSMLGKHIAGDNRVAQVAASALLKTVGQTLGGVLNGVVGKASKDEIKQVLDSFDEELLRNLKLKGIGAVSSFLVSELIDSIGIDGFVGDVVEAGLSEALRSAVANLAGVQVNNVPVNALTAVGSVIGTKLASEIIHFDSVGGQIGSSVGSAVGSIGAVALVTGSGALASEFAALGSFAGPVGAAIGAFVGFILGGLLGSLGGGTPRSGADAVWNEAEGKFVVANVWSKHGSSKQAARSLASAAAETFNAVLSATGGTLLAPQAVQAGNYGMRKSSYVYRDVDDFGDRTITFKASSKEKDSFGRVVGYGVVQGLTDPDFQIAGGDVYVKRAIYNTFDLGGVDAANFDTNALLGNIASAQQYESYLANAGVINALVSAEPDSVFAAETLITLARADELGLTRRHRSDWFGGFDFLVREAGTTAASVDFGFDYDTASGQVSRLIGVGNYVLGDAIDVAGQTTIETGSASDTIDLHTGKLADQTGYTVDGHLNTDIALAGSDFTGVTASLAFAVNELRKSVAVAVSNDGIAEAAETFLGTLANGSGVSIIGGSAQATAIDGTAAKATLLVGRSFAREGDGHAVFRVSLSKAVTGGSVTASLTLADLTTSAGIDRGATLEVSDNGLTWTAVSTLTFSSGQTQKFVRVAVLADNGVDAQGKATNVEGNERFTLTATVTAGADLVANSADSGGVVKTTGTGTVVDASTGTNALAWIDAVVMDETSGQAVFSIARSRGDVAASLDFATADRRELTIHIAATVDAGEGNDVVHASNLGDNVFGGAGNDTLNGGRLDDWLLGGDGDDLLDAGSEDANALGGDGNYLNGGTGNDILRGREGSDWLDGGEGIDQISGGAGDDVVTGGAGDGDSLKGGLDDDQYLIRLGDGADVADDEPNGAPQAAPGGGDYVSQRMAGLFGGTIKKNWAGDAPGVVEKNAIGGEDAIVFGAGIDLSDIQLVRSSTDSDDLIIRVMQAVNGVPSFTGTQLTVKDWFADYFKRIEWLRFVDGTEVRIGDITSFVVGGAGNDVLIGTSGNDFVYGGAGDDQLQLLGGNDIGSGGLGSDMVAGHSGQDLLAGGLGSDQLIGGKGNDALSGDSGDDDLYGGDGDDILSGGRGDGDVVVGGAGNDRFKYSRGDGRDMVFDDYSGAWNVVWSQAGQWNVAGGYVYNSQTGEVTGPGGVYLRKNFGTLEQPDIQWVGRFDYDDLTGTLRYLASDTGAVNNGSDTIEFAPSINIQDIVLVRPAQSNNLVLAIADENSDFTSASSIADSITIRDWFAAPGQIEKLAFYQTGVLDIGTTATNLIAGTDFSDGTDIAPLAGTTAADWITGGAGDDVIAGGSGNDILAGNSGFDKLKGESGSDVLYGGAGDDVLDGGANNDVLMGGNGSDTASYASASTAVRVHLSTTLANTGDATGDEFYSIENLLGGGGADLLGGDEGDNVLTGGQGSDTLLGGAGDDTYVWTASDGADVVQDASFVVQEAVTSAGVLASGYTVTMWQSTGVQQLGSTNRYYWRLQVTGPDGVVVYDYDRFAPNNTNPVQPLPSPASLSTGWLGGFARTRQDSPQVTREKFDTTVNAGDDVLELGSGISLSDLSFIRSGDDLIVRHGGNAATQVTIKGHFIDNSRIEALQFDDGLSVSLASILTALDGNLLMGTSGDDLMLGREGDFADQLDGGAGNDALSGGAGNDLLLGGDGDDALEGGAGADTINGGAHSATSQTGWGDTVRYLRSGAGVAINLTNTAGGQAGGDAAGDVLTGIENVVGSQFADTLTGDAGGNRLFGLGGNDVLNGGAGANVLDGGDGDDTMTGGVDDDNISGGDGIDIVYAMDGQDFVAAGAGNDQVYGGTGNDNLLGDAGDDRLEGNAGHDQLLGGDGADVLVGGDGNDTLAGGANSDWLQGDAGDDVYLFDAASGSDTLVDGSGVNSIVFDSAVRFDDLWLTRLGNDLRIGVIGGDATVTVSNFFAATNPSRVRTISTATHSLFLDHAGTLISAMTAAGAATPTAIPVSIVSQLATYWHEGHKARPGGSPIAVTIAQGTATVSTSSGAVDHDDNITGYQMGGAPSHGTATINAATGAFVYTPDAAFNGTDSFTVIASDADGQAGEIAVTVTVTPATVANGANSLPTSYNMSISENVWIGTALGAVTATDIDSSSIAFGQQRYFFWNGTTASGTSPDGRYSINATTGQIVTATALDYEAGNASAVYTVIARDNAGAAGYNQVSTAVTIGINNVNEDHSLTARTYSVHESNVAFGPSIGVTTTTGAVLNVKSLMLNDPENGANISYRFSDGLQTSGPWTIDATTGAIWMTGSANYEALVAQYETYYDYYGYPYQVYIGQNPSLATFNLTVEAIDNSASNPRPTASAMLTLNVADVNEGPTFTSYNSSGSSSVVYQNYTEYWVMGGKNGGNIIQIQSSDPEGKSGFSYSISNQAAQEVISYYGGSSDIDATGMPTVSISPTGQISFYTPGEGNGGEWEGGLKIGGVRRTSTVYVTFNLSITDADGMTSTTPFKVTFVKRGSSVPPIVFDLDGDGLELVNFDGSTIHFDMDEDGVADLTGWVGPDDGLLALDRNGNGTIDDISEISFASDAAGAISDLEGLRAFDSNANGFFDSSDARYSEFRMWRDINQDGVSQAGELFALADLGIAQINLTLDLTGAEAGGADNVIYATTEYIKSDGTTGTIGDVFLAFEPSDVDALAAPVILDFDGDGASLVSLASSTVRFDMDGDGVTERTGWIENGDAFLALDRNGDGAITDIAEISFVGDLAGAKTDLEGLKAFDINGDNLLSALDERFAGFKLWFDRNSNAVSDAGEIMSLSEAGKRPAVR